MKKLALTAAILLGLGLSTFAQYDEGRYGIQPWFQTGLMGKGPNRDAESNLDLPYEHGLEDDYDIVPVGSGLAVLMGLGAAYLVGKKRREE